LNSTVNATNNWWNGLGNVYIASSPVVSIATDKIWVDDMALLVNMELLLLEIQTLLVFTL
jgi:hypothetical protein